MNKYAILDENNKVINIIISNTPPENDTSIQIGEGQNISKGFYYSNDDEVFYSNPLSMTSNTWNTYSGEANFNEMHFFTGSVNSIELVVNSTRPINTLIPSSVGINQEENIIEISSVTPSEDNMSLTLNIITGSNFQDASLSINFPITESLGYIWELSGQTLKTKV